MQDKKNNAKSCEIERKTIRPKSTKELFVILPTLDNIVVPITFI